MKAEKKAQDRQLYLSRHDIVQETFSFPFQGLELNTNVKLEVQLSYKYVRYCIYEMFLSVGLPWVPDRRPCHYASSTVVAR